MTWATDRLDALVRGEVIVPPVVTTLQLGTLDAWGAGWVRKRWEPKPELMNADGTMFGGYLAALADQILAFATMTLVPGDKTYRTTNLSVAFYKLIRGPIDIEGRALAQSRSLINVEADFRLADGGALAARAYAQQILLDMPG